MDEGAGVAESREQSAGTRPENKNKPGGGKTKLALSDTNLTVASTERSSTPTDRPTDRPLVPGAAIFQVKGYATDTRPELLLNQVRDDTSSCHILPGRSRQKQ